MCSDNHDRTVSPDSVNSGDSGAAITYHASLDESYECWARQCGRPAAELRAATEHAVLSRHGSARIEHPADAATALRPALYTLDLNGTPIVRVHYTVESQAVVIRGYSWDVQNPVDDLDGGIVYCDNDWVRPCFGATSELQPPPQSIPPSRQAEPETENAHTANVGHGAAIRPQIYVASLADYNAGRLHGRWIDADRGVAFIREQIAAMLAESSEEVAEEWAIHDCDNFGGYAVPEFADLETVAEVARLVARHGHVFTALLVHFGGDLEDARTCMEDEYRGTYDNVGAYAAELFEDAYDAALEQLPNLIRYHIDWDGVGRDLELGGDIFTIECGGSVHIFDANP